MLTWRPHLVHEPLELHGLAHVPLHLHLPAHEGRGGLQLAGEHLVEHVGLRTKELLNGCPGYQHISMLN